MKANHKPIALLLLSLMLVKSTDYNQALKPSQRQTILENNPANYFLFPSNTADLTRLSSHAIIELSDLQVFEAQLERALRLLKERKLESASSYSESVFKLWSLRQQTTWLDTLVKTQQFELLKTLASKYTLPSDYQTIVSLANKQQISHIPTVFKSRLSLQIDTQYKSACANKVQVIVDSLDGLLSAENLIRRFYEQPEPFDGAFCFSMPMYSNQQIHCGASESGFAQCEVATNLAGDLAKAKANYQMIVTQTGLANVVGTVMTLNYQSDYNVLVHELMHFSGFEDEYAFMPKKAQYRCKQKGLIAPNLYVGEENDAPEGWEQNASCRHGKFSSFRPASGWTTLEYHEVPLSRVYRAKWAALIQENFGI